MYVGNIKQWEREIPALQDKLMPWIQKLASLDVASLESGRHDLGGENYMNVDDAVTEPAAQRRLEAHHLFADIQYVISGDEIIGYQALCNAGNLTELSEAKDNYFYESDCKNDVPVRMTPGTFAIFMPGDAHRPLCAPAGKCGPVHKIVMKIYLG